MNLQLVGCESPYYESDLFAKILINMNLSRFKCLMRESNARRSIIVENVRNIETALAFIEELKKEPEGIPHTE